MLDLVLVLVLVLVVTCDQSHFQQLPYILSKAITLKLNLIKTQLGWLLQPFHWLLSCCCQAAREYLRGRRFIEGLYQAFRLKRNQSRVWPQIMIEVILEAAVILEAPPFVDECIANRVPRYLSNYFNVRNRDIHRHKTRNNNDLILEKINLECTKRAFFYKGAKIFNNF